MIPSSCAISARPGLGGRHRAIGVTAEIKGQRTLNLGSVSFRGTARWTGRSLSWPARLVVLNVSQHSSGIEPDRIKLVPIAAIICWAVRRKYEGVRFGDFL